MRDFCGSLVQVSGIYLQPRFLFYQVSAISGFMDVARMNQYAIGGHISLVAE